MNIYGWIAGLIVGVITGYYLRQFTTINHKPSSADIAASEHAANIKKTIAYIKGKSEITNDELQHHLGVSDATVQRYLDELEKQGILQQVGTTGRSVSYKIIG